MSVSGDVTQCGVGLSLLPRRFNVARHTAVCVTCDVIVRVTCDTTICMTCAPPPPHSDGCIAVKAIAAGSSAQMSGRIQVGDVLVAVEQQQV